MLRIFKLVEGALKEIETFEADCWVDLSDPSPQELHRVRAEFCIPKDFLIDSLDLAERARVQTLDEYLFMVIRASVATANDIETPFNTIPVGIIITPRAVVTVCRAPFLAESLVKDHLHGMHLRERTLIALLLIQQVCIRYIEHLQIIDSITIDVEKSMRLSMRNEELARMLHIEKTLVYFVTALKANGVILDKLQNSITLNLNTEEHSLLLDAMIECKQATDMADIYAQIISGMSDTFASMISNNMNTVMKFLTGITLILMVPSIVVGLFGMNVPLPWQESVWSLPIILIGTFAVCFAMWRYLAQKKWM